ncbi:MAG: phosphate signaling complex protein PhoU [Spirochaetota bacterium]
MAEEKLAPLKKELIQYGNLAEAMLEKSIRGLTQKQEELLEEVMNEDENQANELEIKLDELCASHIAQFEPRAVELRTTLMILKMNNDLERIADHAVNIAESALFLIKRPPVKPLVDLPNMAETVINMLKDSIGAFIEERPQLAREVCQRDSKVNNLRDQILRELITFMSSDPTTIERSMHLLRVSSNLERVGDLCTNFCEDVIYAVEGTVIKHHFDQRK